MDTPGREGAATGIASPGPRARVPVFVSLTTLPSRIGRLRPTLDSLRAQTLPPDRIFVCVPDRSLREDREYALPEWLRSPPPGVEVVRCGTDHGPGTKLLGCLPRIAGEACLITVDDDLVYRPFLVERLYRAQLDRPAASFSFFVYDVGRFRCGQSADGFSFWTPNLARVEAFAARMLRSPHLFVPDDLWISLYLQNEGSPSPACSTPCRPVSSSESDRPIGTAARSARRAPSSVARDARGGHRSWAVRGRSA